MTIKNKVHRFPRLEREKDVFHSFEDFENARPLNFAIDGIVQNESATLIAGLAGHGKTLILLSIAKALLADSQTELWNQFQICEKAYRVVYLIPESSISPFKDRLRRFELYDYVYKRRLLVSTLSKEVVPSLSDPEILYAANGAYVFLDSVIRFVDGNENEAADNQRGLAKNLFGLLNAGARAVIGAHHSPKAFGKENAMTLENALRGSGDIGAMVSTAWAIKQLNSEKNIIHLENVKARDFEHCGPFQIVGRPHIDESHDFKMYKKPGECGSLQEETKGNKGGASASARERKATNKKLLQHWLKSDPHATSEELSERFKGREIRVKPGTIRRYRSEMKKNMSSG